MLSCLPSVKKWRYEKLRVRVGGIWTIQYLVSISLTLGYRDGAMLKKPVSTVLSVFVVGYVCYVGWRVLVIGL
jgi:hypothetical protein